MTARPTPEEKQHIIDLIRELKDIIENLPKVKNTKEERGKIADRMQEIKGEMQAFRRMYPFD